jgi:hypothetical protein
MKISSQGKERRFKKKVKRIKTRQKGSFSKVRGSRTRQKGWFFN